jgi:hypothetical protein
MDTRTCMGRCAIAKNARMTVSDDSASRTKLRNSTAAMSWCSYKQHAEITYWRLAPL